MQGYQDFHYFQIQNAANSKCEMQHFVNPNCYNFISQSTRLPSRRRINFKTREVQFFVIIFVYLGAVCLHGCQ